MREKKRKTIEEAIDQVWNELFDLICNSNDSLYELKIVYKEDSTGKTIVKSWRDMQMRLQQNELESRKMALPKK